MLRAEHLSKTYREKDLQVIEDISFTIEPSEILMITGPSGCGKSTLLNIISGILKDFGGRLNSTFGKIGYIFQEDRLLEWKTVLENVRLVAPKESEERARKLLKEVGLEGFEDYYPRDLSGGMRQRCAIARALCYGSDILLLDEPFKSLDHRLRTEMLNLMHRIRLFEKTALLFVTHDIEEAVRLGDRVLVLTGRPTRIKEEIVLTGEYESRDAEARKYKVLKEKIIKAMES